MNEKTPHYECKHISGLPVSELTLQPLLSLSFLLQEVAGKHNMAMIKSSIKK